MNAPGCQGTGKVVSLSSLVLRLLEEVEVTDGCRVLEIASQVPDRRVVAGREP